MANRGFQFKQFKIAQEKAPLKVGTDACILGAWAQHAAPVHILDIGTGTGLLALMLAQRYSAPIDALEPEPTAAHCARENFASSPWADRISLHQQPVQEFISEQEYDLIICNPPFYPNHLRAQNTARNSALHQNSLDFVSLAKSCKRLLSETGICYILLPPRQGQVFKAIAQMEGLHPQRRLLVQERKDTPVHRTVVAYGHSAAASVQENSLVIRAEGGEYSQAYRKLLQPYYLIF